MVSGMVGAGNAQLPKMAGQFPSKAKKESRIKRFYRWLRNKRIQGQIYFPPFAEHLITSLAHLPLVLVIDGSTTGRGCMTPMIGLIYKKRALPLSWLTVEGKKGHLSRELHLELLRQVQPFIPKGTEVIFLGDGEFDGIELQAFVDNQSWKYACRTAKNIVLELKGQQFRYEDMTDCMKPGQDFEAPDVLFSKERYGPVLAVGWWKKGEKEPIYLVSNMNSSEKACQWYAKRFTIETFFSDRKSRGFHIQKSHLFHPDRVSRLLIAACIAYHRVICLGGLAVRKGWDKIIHRTDRCDLSLFQLGLSLLDHFLLEDIDIPIPVDFGPCLFPSPVFRYQET